MCVHIHAYADICIYPFLFDYVSKIYMCMYIYIYLYRLNPQPLTAPQAAEPSHSSFKRQENGCYTHPWPWVRGTLSSAARIRSPFHPALEAPSLIIYEQAVFTSSPASEPCGAKQPKAGPISVFQVPKKESYVYF